MLLPTLIASATVALLLTWGVSMIVGAAIGAAVPTAPACSRCGHAIPPLPGQALGRCQECGADLAARDMVRYFRRRRQGGRIARGVAVVIATLVGVPIIVRILMMASSPNVSGPSTSQEQLVADLRTGAQVNLFAATEAGRRAQSGTLSDVDLRALLDAARAGRAAQEILFVQPDEVTLIAAAVARGMLDGEALGAELDTLFDPLRFDLPTTVRPPRQVSLSVPHTMTAGGVQRTLSLEGMTLDGTAVPLSDYNGASGGPIAGGSGCFVTLDGAPGDHTLVATVREQFLSSGGGAPLPPTTVTRTWSTTIRMVDPNGPTWIRLDAPERRRAEVASAFRVLRVAVDPPIGGGAEGPCVVRAETAFDDVPEMTVAFDVVVRLGEVECIVGQHLVQRTPSTISTWGGPVQSASCVLPRPLPTEATVILRPNPALAEVMHQVDSVWGEEVRIEHVPVVTLPAPAQGGRP